MDLQELLTLITVSTAAAYSVVKMVQTIVNQKEYIGTAGCPPSCTACKLKDDKQFNHRGRKEESN